MILIPFLYATQTSSDISFVGKILFFHVLLNIVLFVVYISFDLFFKGVAISTGSVATDMLETWKYHLVVHSSQR